MQDWVKTVPKAVLHDHLDGGLRVDSKKIVSVIAFFRTEEIK